MGTLLKFFCAGGLQLKALIVAAGVMAAMVLSLTTWAFFERSRYMECRGTTIALGAQVNVLGDKLDRQGESILLTAAAGQTAIQAVEAMREDARKDLEGSWGFLAQAKAAIAGAVPKRADGTDKGCSEARAEIKAARGRK